MKNRESICNSTPGDKLLYSEFQNEIKNLSSRLNRIIGGIIENERVYSAMYSSLALFFFRTSDIQIIDSY